MIAHVAYSGVGGTGSFVAELCPQMTKDNAGDVHVIFYGVEPLHSDYGRILDSAQIQYSVIGKKRGIDLSSIYALAREIRRIKPRTVVLHGGGTGWHWPLLRLLGVRARVVLVEHGLTGKWIYARHVISIFFAHALVAISEPLAAALRTRFGGVIGNKPLWTIPNGIDESFFRPAENVRSDDLILCVATLSAVKDQATLIRACTRLSESHRVRLVLAGDGLNRSSLEQLARESGINDRITFLGNVGRARLLELYQSAAVFVLSTRSEGISLALLEAMACGCPIVATDVPGVTEVLAGTGAAVLVPQGDVPQMAEAIGNLLDHRELGIQMGNIARECVLRNYSSRRMAARYKDVLNQV